MKQAFRKAISFFFLLTVLTFAAQAGNIHGTVTDRVTNEPLTGATIQLSGTTLGTGCRHGRQVPIQQSQEWYIYA